MQTPRVFLADGPHGLCDAYGWFIGRRHDGSHAADERSVSVRPDQLGKLSQGTFYSPPFGRPVLNHLSAAQKRRQAKHARP
jgi:hypothetical protein